MARRWTRSGAGFRCPARQATEQDCGQGNAGEHCQVVRHISRRQVDAARLRPDHADPRRGRPVGRVRTLGGDGGVIVMGKDGVHAFSMNTSGMYRGEAGSMRADRVAIYADEER